MFCIIEIKCTRIISLFNHKNQTTSLQKAIYDKIKYKIRALLNREASRTNGSNIKFIFVGDIKTAKEIHDEVEYHHYGDYTFLFDLIKNDLQNADFRIANLEGGITNSTIPLKPVQNCTSNSTDFDCCGMKCHFKSPETILNGIVQYADFNLLTIENNHIDDFLGGRNDTIKVLEKYDIPFMAYKRPHNVRMKGCEFEFFAYNFIEKLNNLTDDEIKNQIKEDLLTSSNDSFKILYVHDGKQYHHHVTKRQKFIAHFAIDHGADMVIYAHAHVTEKFAVYKGKHIAFGLGNFVFDKTYNDTDKFYFLNFEIENCKNVKNFQHKNGTINSEYQPSL